VYREISVRPAITASGPITHHGGSKLRPEVFEAMQAASQVMVDVHELNDRAGASAGLLLQAAAVMAGADPPPQAAPRPWSTPLRTEQPGWR